MNLKEGVIIWCINNGSEWVEFMNIWFITADNLNVNDNSDEYEQSRNRMLV